ncbi:MAG TPA: RNA-binding domain-containing protein [Methanobacterium sp.]|nr:RNA-binding domain-containing protein [Methanobacterium sp.]
MKCEMKAKTPLNPTEDVDKVIQALINMFDYDELEIRDGYVQVTGGESSLLKLKESLEIRKIRNTARKILSRGIHDKVIFFKLNKQAAFSGVVNFADDNISPLGEIKVKIETSNIDRFIDWLAPLQE